MEEETEGRLVVIESPFAGNVERNLIYLRKCIRECCLRGDSPYASHRMLTDALDEDIPEERTLGIDLGLMWRRRADMRLFYVDLGWSRGMLAAKELYDREDLPHEYRMLGGYKLSEAQGAP